MIKYFFVSFFVILSFVPATAQSDTMSSMSLDEAFSYYQKVLEKNPGSVYATYGLAKCHYLSGNYRATINIAKKYAFKNNAFQTDFIIIYSMALIATEQMDKSISVLKRAIDIFPDNSQLYYYRAFSYYKLSNLENAFNDVKKSVELKDSFYASHLLLGIVMYERNNDRNALSPLYYALFLNSKGIWAKNTLFIIHSILNQRHDRIVIPYHEERFKLINIEELLTVYCSGFLIKNWNPLILNFVAYSSDYIKTNVNFLKTLDHSYYDFFTQLNQSQHLLTFCYFILQSLNSQEVDDWFRGHSEELLAFAKWIEDNPEL